MSENVVIYARVSTARQSDNFSLQAQIKECTNFALNKKYNIAETITEVGSAFKIGKQINLNKIISDLSSNNNLKITRLIVHSFDRFARNLRQAIDNIDLLLKKNIVVESVTDNVDYMSPSGRHQLNILFSSSEYQSAVLGSKVKMGMNFSKGVSTTQPSNEPKKVTKTNTPYGFDKIQGQMVPNTFEQTAIKFIICSRDSICNSTELSEIIFSIMPSSLPQNPIEFYENDNIIEFMRPQELTYQEIANLLNEYGILKRNDTWTTQNVSYIYNKYKHHSEDLSNNYKLLREENKEKPSKKRRLK